ncbi:M20/M25/M40 family metallo-hydrolase [Acidobacteria bacterium ACD]|nr:M20/M25/M40 family metallo-hydrolase [Acidobacteria bacterium ACD]
MTGRAGAARLLVLAALLATAPAKGADEGLAASGRRMLADVRALTSEAFGGRRAGTRGADDAAAFVASSFRASGLLPAGKTGSYLQPFSFVDGATPGPGNRLSAAVGAPVSRGYRLDEDFRPLALSASGTVEADVAFCGYGIASPETGYDDYAGVDVRGKAVLVLRGGPGGDDPDSPFARHFPLRAKLDLARRNGAAALLVAPARGDALVSLRTDFDVEPSALPGVSVRRRVAEALFAGSGTTLAALQARIDGAAKPAPLPLPRARVTLAVDLVPHRATTANVAGLVPGRDPVANRQAVLFGAHYDHLGDGGAGSLDRSPSRRIHPGADDNASGTALLLELARTLSRRRGELKRSALLVAFGAEEEGSLGARVLAGAPPVPLGDVAAVICLDMVGRLPREGLIVRGTGTSPRFRDLVASAAREAGLAVRPFDPAWGPSDHAVFLAAGRPVLFLFTGYHRDYHRPSDTADRLDVSGMERIHRFLEVIALRLLGDAEPLPFSRVPGDGVPARAR